jgi:hypothetical protein
MTSTNQHGLPEQPSDPALFAPLTLDENHILRGHLTSGWYKQSVVYPTLSEPWQETSGLLDDLHAAWRSAFEARAAATTEAEVAEPEPGAGL